MANDETLSLTARKLTVIDSLGARGDCAAFDSGLEEPAPWGDQTIALLSSRLWSRDCPAYTAMHSNQAFVVLPDLSRPDPRVKKGAASLGANSYPVLYRGKTPAGQPISRTRLPCDRQRQSCKGLGFGQALARQ